MTANNEANGASSSSPRGKAVPPQVRLGHLATNGISASMYGLVERGAAKRPELAREVRGKVELRLDEDFAPVRMTFTEDEVVVEDGGAGKRWKPDLVISGSLPDVARLAVGPLVGGMPKLTDARGRAALASLAGGKVRLEGSLLLGRRLLRLLAI